MSWHELNKQNEAGEDKDEKYEQEIRIQKMLLRNFGSSRINIS